MWKKEQGVAVVGATMEEDSKKFRRELFFAVYQELSPPQGKILADQTLIRQPYAAQIYAESFSHHNIKTSTPAATEQASARPVACCSHFASLPLMLAWTIPDNAEMVLVLDPHICRLSAMHIGVLSFQLSLNGTHWLALGLHLTKKDPLRALYFCCPYSDNQIVFVYCTFPVSNPSINELSRSRGNVQKTCCECFKLYFCCNSLSSRIRLNAVCYAASDEH